MAEGTYENECERAELLGVEPPNRVDWEESNRARRQNELAEQMTVFHLNNKFVQKVSRKLIFFLNKIGNQHSR